MYGITHANIKDLSGTVTLTAEEDANILNAIPTDNYLKSIDKATFDFLDKGADVIGEKVFLAQLKAHVNANTPEMQDNLNKNPTKFAQGFVQKYIGYMEKEIAKVSAQTAIDRKTDLMVQGVKFNKEHVPK